MATEARTPAKRGRRPRRDPSLEAYLARLDDARAWLKTKDGEAWRKSLQGTPWAEMTESELAAVVVDMRDAPELDKKLKVLSEKVEDEAALLRTEVEIWIDDEGRPGCDEGTREELADKICSALIEVALKSRKRQAGWKLYTTNEWKRALRRTQGKSGKVPLADLAPEDFPPSERALAGMAFTWAIRGGPLAVVRARLEQLLATHPPEFHDEARELHDEAKELNANLRDALARPGLLDVPKAQQERKRLAGAVFAVLSDTKGKPIVSYPDHHDQRVDNDAEQPTKRYCPAAPVLLAVWDMAGIPSKKMELEYPARLIHEVRPHRQKRER